ncbi:MAG: DTW domain-containing protein [Proteobacteria bacterium]|nr:MAG: DTW domain-containing protein [Pseudomonadota bacterium]
MSRHYCTNCKRPLRVCYCSALVQLANTIKVVIIQHPQEEKHPFNTGRMTHLCLSNSELVIAETLSQPALGKILSAPSILLYPSLPWLPPQPDPDLQSAPGFQQLIIIDATWRKSKKILHSHPELQRLPRLSLGGDRKSNYTIRKTSVTNGLSTIESAAEALAILEPQNNFQPMLKPFEKMISLQQENQARALLL